MYKEHGVHLDDMISSGDVSNATWQKACKHSLGKVIQPTQGPLRANGRLITGDRERVNLHNDFLVSQSLVGDPSITPPLLESNCQQQMSPFITLPEEVYKVLIHLHQKNPSGLMILATYS